MSTVESQTSESLGRPSQEGIGRPTTARDPQTTGIALVGNGFVADYYAHTLSRYAELRVRGVLDKNAERAKQFAKFHSLPVYSSLQHVLEDAGVEIVVNLTSITSHYDISKAALLAGKHVYSEKPLATELSEAQELVEIAHSKGLYLSCAPCSILGETAQTIWKALRERAIGPVRLVYAELDDGLIHRMAYQNWISESGTPWPSRDEFEAGCTLEHAAYYLTWLCAFFGPAQSVSAYAACLIEDKVAGVPLDRNAPDFSVACIRFESGVVARLTCSIVALHNHSLQIFGDDGVLSTHDCWYYDSPVFIERYSRLGHRLGRYPFLKKLAGRGKRRYRLVRRFEKPRYRGAHRMDFARGVAELAAAVRDRRPCRLSAEFSLHVNELVLAIQGALEDGVARRMTSTFPPVLPEKWACDPAD